MTKNERRPGAVNSGLREVGHSEDGKRDASKRNLYFHYDTPLGRGVDTVENVAKSSALRR
jgi:hypothetical protein